MIEIADDAPLVSDHEQKEAQRFFSSYFPKDRLREAAESYEDGQEGKLTIMPVPGTMKDENIKLFVDIFM
ncbi:MAG TPA: hypothetical protein PLU95_05005 [Syntrophales bacterium]|nr:hypothetical protein [Syntrophales bacterium]HOD99224.1 hypothetical protein [Syntrophales bacterium]HOH73969.1 hypothetical protein [Syntrophales bacterium]HPN08640.1 hypothetical protein [Syntrophales bacterium]HPX82700.1 hypothetical protein [Syntrophales bacterium]